MAVSYPDTPGVSRYFNTYRTSLESILNPTHLGVVVKYSATHALQNTFIYVHVAYVGICACM